MARSAKRDKTAVTPLEGIQKIRRVTLHGSVLSQLRDMIIEGTLVPGARVNESQLGVLLGVSRTPLREAIKSLAGEGLVTIEPAKGATVRDFTLEDARCVIEALQVIEQGAAPLACARASQADLDRLRHLHEAMLERYHAQDRLGYFKLNQSIHSGIVALSGNPVLCEAHDKLQSQIRRIRFMGNQTPQSWASSIEDHNQILDALLTRNGARLAQTLGAHLEQGLERAPQFSGLHPR